MTPLYDTDVPSPIGVLHLVAGDDGLQAIDWPGQTRDRSSGPVPTHRPDHPVLRQAAQEITEYFNGTRRVFTVPLDPQGTDFQQRAWQALRQIPFGETRSYGDQARMIGQPQAVRAVGGANGRNPLPIIVPCHRVIGQNGSLTGFGGGLHTKQMLLNHEQRVQSA